MLTKLCKNTLCHTVIFLSCFSKKKLDVYLMDRQLADFKELYSTFCKSLPTLKSLDLNAGLREGEPFYVTLTLPKCHKRVRTRARAPIFLLAPTFLPPGAIHPVIIPEIL